MNLYVKFKSKEKISDTLCCWCYEISRDDNRKFKRGEGWGLDFPIATDIRDPNNFTTCNKYGLGTKGGTFPNDTKKAKKDTPPAGATHWVPNVTLEEDVDKFTICFVAPCAENKDTTISLETWSNLRTSDGVEGHGWGRLDFEGSSKLPGPAIASRVPRDPNGLVALLAQYEGLKLSHLLGSTHETTPPHEIVSMERLTPITRVRTVEPVPQEAEETIAWREPQIYDM